MNVLISPEAPFSWTMTLVENKHAQTSSHNRSPCSFMFCIFLFIVVFVFSHTIKCHFQNMIDCIILSNLDLTGIKYFCYQTYMIFLICIIINNSCVIIYAYIFKITSVCFLNNKYLSVEFEVKEQAYF